MDGLYNVYLKVLTDDATDVRHRNRITVSQTNIIVRMALLEPWAVAERMRDRLNRATCRLTGAVATEDDPYLRRVRRVEFSLVAARLVVSDLVSFDLSLEGTDLEE